jgi:hypothetical protein
MMVTKRTEMLTARMAPEDMKMLQELADADNVYLADVLRRLIRQAHAERFPSKPSKRKR